MTWIKYVTIAVSKDDRVLVMRGKKTGEIGYLPVDDDEDPFSNPIHAHEHVELPEMLTPTEYDEWLENVFRPDDVDDPVSKAVDRVTRELEGNTTTNGGDRDE